MILPHRSAAPNCNHHDEPFEAMSLMFTRHKRKLPKAKQEDRQPPSSRFYPAVPDDDVAKENRYYPRVELLPSSLHKEQHSITRRYPAVEDVNCLPSLSSHHNRIAFEDSSKDDASECSDEDEFASEDYPVKEAITASLETTTTSSAGDEEHVLEVALGVYQTLRGAAYTAAAYQAGRCVSAVCFVCAVGLAAAPDCAAVVCPQCFSVSPIVGVDSSCHYVGIGLALD